LIENGVYKTQKGEQGLRKDVTDVFAGYARKLMRRVSFGGASWLLVRHPAILAKLTYRILGQRAHWRIQFKLVSLTI
jgi:hypothetical protein